MNLRPTIGSLFGPTQQVLLNTPIAYELFIYRLIIHGPLSSLANYRHEFHQILSLFLPWMFYNYGLPLLFESPLDVDFAYQDYRTLSYFLVLVSQNTVGFGGSFYLFIYLFYFILKFLRFASFFLLYLEILLALLSRRIGIGSSEWYMLRDFSIKVQNKSITQSFNCKM